MGLFEPDILNDAGRRRAAATLPAERRLMAAILTDAVECFRKNLAAPTRKRRRLFVEAEQWIRSEDIDWVFSVRNICDVLGVDIAALRAQAENWKHHQLRSVTAEHHYGIAS